MDSNTKPVEENLVWIKYSDSKPPKVITRVVDNVLEWAIDLSQQSPKPSKDFKEALEDMFPPEKNSYGEYNKTELQREGAEWAYLQKEGGKDLVTDGLRWVKGRL